MSRLFRTRCSFIVKEDDIARALKVLNRRRLDCDTRISNCGGMEKDKWCIEIRATDSEWAAIAGIFIKEGIKTY